MNVEYEFYQDFYGGGNISDKDWKRLPQKAESRLKEFTFGRLPDQWEGEEWEEQAKCAVCEMAELLFTEEKRAGKTSENTDGYSVSYDTNVSGRSKLYETAYAYLGYTGMMNLGVDGLC